MGPRDAVLTGEAGAVIYTSLLTRTPCCPRHLTAHKLQDKLLRVSRAQGGSCQALTPARAPGSRQQSPESLLLALAPVSGGHVAGCLTSVWGHLLARVHTLTPHVCTHTPPVHACPGLPVLCSCGHRHQPV